MDQPTPSPNAVPEAQPQPTSLPEGLGAQSANESAPAAPEQIPKPNERAAERLPNPEKRVTSQGSVPLPPVQVQPTAVPPAVNGQADEPTAADDMPLIADDVDVIEMEWVNKAKQIIKQTSNDPHAQEKAVEKLQSDYLKKRYGKEIKSSRS